MSPQERWALVPVKPFELAKTRLAPVLTRVQRAALAQELLERTLATLRRVGQLDGIAVLSCDSAVLSLGERYAATPICENLALTGLAAHIDDGLARLSASGAGTVLVVLADLPGLCVPDIEQMLRRGERHSLVIAPDAWGEGTNALLLRPPGCMPTCFGRRNSFAAHTSRAHALGLDAVVHTSVSFGFDLDTVDHLLTLLNRGGHGLRALEGLDFRDREDVHAGF